MKLITKQKLKCGLRLPPRKKYISKVLIKVNKVKKVEKMQFQNSLWNAEETKRHFLVFGLNLKLDMHKILTKSMENLKSL